MTDCNTTPVYFSDTVFSGDSYDLQFEWSDSASAAVDMTGYTLTGTLRKNAADEAVIASLTSDLSYTDQVGGKFQLKIPAATTSPLRGQYSVGVTATSPSGDPITMAEGKVTFLIKTDR